MSHAPAGWYEHPDAPGVARYWDGVRWLAAGTGPVVAASEPAFAPQEAVFTPALHVADVPESLGTEATASEDDVPWDVVGMPRVTRPVASPQTADAPWQGSAAVGAGMGAPSASAQPWAPTPAVPQYAAPFTPRRRVSGMGKVGITLAVAVVGFVVRWGLSTMFGGDYSDDGPIQVAVPIEWETYTASNPNLTYAMDSSWIPVLSSKDVQLASAGTHLIDARVITTGVSANGGLLILTSSIEPFPNGKVSREDWTGAFEEALTGIEATGDATVTDSKKSVLTSKAGDKWGFLDATITTSGSEVHFYVAAAGIDGYLVVMELIVPPGAELTQNDILAVANSIEAR